MPLLFDYACLTRAFLEDVVGRVKAKGGALLANHRVVFGGASPAYQGCAVAGAKPHDGTEVIGMVYRLSREQLDLLDVFMECPSVVVRVPASVADACDKVRDVQMYTLPHDMTRKRCLGPPSPSYARLHKQLVLEAYEHYRNKRFPPEPDDDASSSSSSSSFSSCSASSRRRASRRQRRRRRRRRKER
jgi:hypothetical protein